MPKRKKRLVVIADLHSGHRVGLTPPKYQWMVGKDPDHVWAKYARIQKECWAWYEKTARALKPIDILVVNGDCIDGRGERSGGVELITGDRSEQCDIAAESIKLWGAKHIIMVRGTPYHTGDKEDWEDVIYRRVRAEKIGEHEWIDINGTVFDFKHHIGSSTIPHGQFTAVARDQLWNALWAEAEYQPRADWIIRSHVHYCRWCGGFRGAREWQAFITPALQAMGSRFGARRCSNLVDFGLAHWDIDAKGNTTWQKHVAPIISQKARALKL